MNEIDQIVSEVKGVYLESGKHIKTFENCRSEDVLSVVISQ
jgi:hypothetical protein